MHCRLLRSLTVLVPLLVPSRTVAAQATSATHTTQATQTPGTGARPELTELLHTLDSMMHAQPVNFAAYSSFAERSRVRVAELVAADELRTPADFLAASRLMADPSGFFENRRVEHELALTALVLGDTGALHRVALSWDGLNWSMGRGQRLGSYTRNGVPNNMDPVPAPLVIRELFKDIAAARRRAVAAMNDTALQRMRDADQADRTGEPNAAMMSRMRANDPARRARVLQLVADGVPATGRDFQNAATVMQHGETPDDYRLAHELTITAIALGDTSAVWLLSRSYDRMLLSMGHRQRLNTQYGGSTMSLMPLDTSAVNDRIRVALGSRRLADAARPPIDK